MNMLPFYQKALNERSSGYQKLIIMFTFWDWLLQFSTSNMLMNCIDNVPFVFQIGWHEVSHTKYALSEW